MKRLTAHITIEGEPLCQCEGHVAGLMAKLGLPCEFNSIADATRAKKKIQTVRHSVKVVRGLCPTFALETK